MANVIFKVAGRVVGRLDQNSNYVPEPGCPDHFGDWRYEGFPRIRTDKQFMQNRSESEIHGDINLWRMRQAERAGVNVAGKLYMSTLARFPGDPCAWVSDASDVRRLARERNWRVEGAVNVEPVERDEPPPEPIAVADDIVARRVQKVLEVDPMADVEEVWQRQKDLASGKTVLPSAPMVSDHNFEASSEE